MCTKTELAGVLVTGGVNGLVLLKLEVSARVLETDGLLTFSVPGSCEYAP